MGERRGNFYKASKIERAAFDLECEESDHWFKNKIAPSKLDEAEMRLRNEPINKLVLYSGMDREEARVQVMRERTTILYADNPYANPAARAKIRRADYERTPLPPEDLTSERREQLGRLKELAGAPK